MLASCESCLHITLPRGQQLSPCVIEQTIYSFVKDIVYNFKRQCLVATAPLVMVMGPATEAAEPLLGMLNQTLAFKRQAQPDIHDRFRK